jgi:hypothetical protein
MRAVRADRPCVGRGRRARLGSDVTTASTHSVRRPRALRRVAWLLLGLLALQWAAQLCAAHCGIAAPAVRMLPFAVAAADARTPGPGPSAVEQAPVGPAGVAAADALVAAHCDGSDVRLASADAEPAADAPCPMIDACDLGQAAMLAGGPPVRGELPGAQRPAATSPVPHAFLRAPEERPPTA